MNLRETAEGMARLAEKRGEVHPWWALGEAVAALYELDNEHAAYAVEQLEKIFQERTGND